MAINHVCLALLGIVALAAAEPWIAEPRTDATFKHRHEYLLNMTHHHASEAKVVFLGASTMQNWLGNGGELWHKHYEPRHAYNYGIGGDRTEHVLWRIAKGELDGMTNLKLVVLCVGFNNANNKVFNQPADIDKGISAVLEALKAKVPHAKILLVNILPSGHHNHVIHQTNKLLARHEDRKTVYNLDLTSYYEISPEHINAKLFVHDEVHLTKEGYELWYKAMEPLFAKLTSSPESHPWIAQERVDAHHKERHLQLVKQSRAHGAEEKIIFIGASSVEHWGLDGKELWEKHYAPRHAFNYGINGDCTEHVLWRIAHGELDSVKAKLVVLIIGSNNVRNHDHPEDISKAISAIIAAIEGKIPGVKVLLLSILPRGKYNHHVHLTNKLLAKLDDGKKVHFLDLTSHFELTSEHINPKLYLSDQLHLTKEGYQVWYQAMEPLFSKLIA